MLILIHSTPSWEKKDEETHIYILEMCFPNIIFSFLSELTCT